MGNPIRDRSSLPSFLVSQACCCLTLGTGSLAIGIFQLICFVLWIIGGTQSGSNSGYVNIVNAVLMLVSGIMIIYGNRKGSASMVWLACYINLVVFFWAIICAIINFINLLWVSAVAIIINSLLSLYFAVVLRSYAFELEDSSTGVNPA